MNRRRMKKCVALLTAFAASAMVSFSAYAYGPGGPGQCLDAEGNPVQGVVERGITVSKYQNRASETHGGINWRRVKESGIDFAMIRLGYLNDADPYFHQNMGGAQTEDISTGVFFYTQALTDEDVAQEADYVLSQIKNYRIAYPVAYDVESQVLLDNGLTKDQITAHAKMFCDRIAAAGYRPMVYANKNWLDNYLDASKLTDSEGHPYDIWYARYNSEGEYPNRTIWQYTESGTVDGIWGNVAMEYAFVDYHSLIPAEGWRLIGGSWYYVKDYKFQTGWLSLDDKMYYLEPDGRMISDIQTSIDGVAYQFGSDGALVTG